MTAFRTRIARGRRAAGRVRGCTGQILAGEDVEDGEADDRRGGGGQASPSCIVASERAAEQREVHHVAAHPGPDRSQRALARENPHAARELADTDGEQGIAVGLVVLHADHAGDPAGGRDLGQAEAEA